MTSSYDSLVLGSGPAALLVAASLAELGLRTGLLAPAPEAPWRPTYGGWRDELAPVLGDDAFDATWSRVEVVFPEAARALDRAYARVDKRALQDRLLRQLQGRGASTVAASAASVAHDPTGSTVTDTTGQTWRAGVVIDATGAESVLLQRRPGPAQVARQVAFGWTLRARRHPFALDTATWMDWRPARAGEDRVEPSFLYALPLSEERVFVEETSLAAAPGLPIPVLRSRLMARLAQMEVSAAQVEDEEICVIPMNPPPPILGQRLVGFGAAAGLVHPSTGYTLGRSALRAPAAAAVIAEGLGRGAPPATVAKAAWSAVWPVGARVNDALHRFGLDRLLALDSSETQAFFRAFFATDPSRWSAWLATDASVPSTLGSMAATWWAADASTRGRLLRAGLGEAPRLLSQLQLSLGGTP